MTAFVRFWVLLSTLLVSAGWILSAVHQLNRAGYLVVFALAGIAYAAFKRKYHPPSRGNLIIFLYKFLQRCHRPAPLLFLGLVVLSLLSGALHPALNYDANAYRLPRIFHWLAAGQWHWIHTYDFRMNVSGCGYEWLAAPLVAFTHTDRLIFLPNWISYLMLPGLIFSVFTRLQVRPRVAWWWAWLLSSAWCFSLQASSVDNDGFAVIYALASVDLALRARKNGKVADLWLSLLAAALLTGAKQTNAPLVLLWLIAVWPGIPQLRRYWAGTAGVALVGLLVSIVPITWFNFHYGGSLIPEDKMGTAMLGTFHLTPFWGILGNAFCIPVQNLVPPFYYLMPPLYDTWPYAWNQIMADFVQTPFGSHFASFEKFGFLSAVYYNGISEGNAGIGLGICILMLVSIYDARRLRKRLALPIRSTPDPVAFWLRIAPWLALLVFMSKVGTFENARHLAPYYPFLFPLFLARQGHEPLVRQCGWQRFGLAIMMLTAVMIVKLTDRPLFPAQTIFTALYKNHPKSEIISHEYFSYVESNYQATEARRKFLETTLPPDEKVVGYFAQIISGLDENGIWLGGHRAVCVLPNDPPQRLRAMGIHYVVLNGNALNLIYGNIRHWLEKYNASVVCEYTFPRKMLEASRMGTPADFYIVKLN
ncbi:MAG TPA: hypothetical protein VMH30_10415 [Verrucomicrobiae bacterium]|nr:hypothetical protein [Verrucomicrobiae bacterium]